MVTFMHYRRYDRQGQIMACGGLTLAIEKIGDDSVTVAMAQCAVGDNFNRKLGRTIAEGRLRHRRDGEHLYNLELPEATSLKSFIHNQDFVRERVKKLLAGAGK